MRLSKVAIILFFPFITWAQAINSDSSFVSYIKSHSELLNELLSDSSKRIQICFTRFKKDSVGFVPFTYKFINDKYFYPASTVKLPLAILAMEKMTRLGIELEDVLKLEDDVDCGNKKFVSLTKHNDLTFRTLIEEMIVVSDNFYYNCLYHFVTPKEINNRLKELGFMETNIYRSFSGCDVVNHLKTNSLKVFNSKGEEVYAQPSLIMDLCDMSSCYILTENKKLGNRHEYKKEILDGPYDFNYNLEIPLEELHLMMLKLAKPELFNPKSCWMLTNSAREFLISACSKFPSELKNVKYKDAKKHPDSWCKFSYLSDSAMDTGNDRTISKLGLSYGFTTEVAYVLNRGDGIQFLLSVSIYTNANKIVNDGIYEYQEIARPFISALTNVLTNHELGCEDNNSVDIELDRMVFN